MGNGWHCGGFIICVPLLLIPLFVLFRAIPGMQKENTRRPGFVYTTGEWNRIAYRMAMLTVVLLVVLLMLWQQQSASLSSAGSAEISTSGEFTSLESKPSTYRHAGCSLMGPDATGGRRVVAVGDVHGDYNGLLEVFHAANLTTEKTSCTWRTQDVPTVLVQMGDLTDRGPGAPEALDCLRSLQATASAHNAEVVRLLGNHELWWLTGLFHMRNRADTEERIIRFLQHLHADIMDYKVVGSHLMEINHVPVLFVHAGFTQDFLKYLQLPDAVSVSNYTRNHLRHGLQQCQHLPCPALTRDELYEAGPSRGGQGIGGPYWTDFGTLKREDELRVKSANKTLTRPFIQIVGHTMAYCYDPSQPGVHPPDSVAECGQGLIRGTADLSSICVDGGMYAGGRAFLEITPRGHLVAHELRPQGESEVVMWRQRDLSERLCASV